MQKHLQQGYGDDTDSEYSSLRKLAASLDKYMDVLVYFCSKLPIYRKFVWIVVIVGNKSARCHLADSLGQQAGQAFLILKREFPIHIMHLSI